MSSSELDTEIDLIELVDVLWQGKYLIGGLTRFRQLDSFRFPDFHAEHASDISIHSVAVAARNQCLRRSIMYREYRHPYMPMSN